MAKLYFMIATLYNDGNWHHVAVTRTNASADNVKLFIDGQSVAMGTVNSTVVTDNLSIGVLNYGGYQQFFDGAIDEVRIWNTAIADDKIADRMNCELQGTENGLLAYYKFNQGSDAADNTAITTLTATTGTDATLINFGLNGATSNWLADSPVITDTSIPDAPVASNQWHCTTSTVADLTATGTGGTLNWYNVASGGTVLATTDLLTNATYYVAEMNANGCESDRTTVVVSILTASIDSQTDILCNGLATGSATVNATGGIAPYSYTWDNAAITASITDVLAGTYTVTVTDANGCTATTSVTITEPTALSAVISSQTNISCNGSNDGAATVNATGGTAPYTYIWNNGATTASITDVLAGNYTVTVTDANGCTASTSVTITEPAPVFTNITYVYDETFVNGQSYCPGSANYDNWGIFRGNIDTTLNYSRITLLGSALPGGITCTDPSAVNQIAQALATGTAVSVTVNGNVWNVAVGCKTSCTIEGDAIELNVNNGINGCSCGNGPTIRPCIGNINWGGLSGTACGASTQNIRVELVGSNIEISNVSCNGADDGAITLESLGGVAPYTFSWSPGNPTGQGTNSISELAPGEYDVTVTDANGCTKTATATVTEPDVLVAAVLVNNNVSCNGGSDGTATASVTGGTAPYSYLWDDTDASTTASVSTFAAGTYNVTVTDANGCTATTSVTITEPTVLSASTVVDANVSCNGGSNGSATVNVTGGTSPYRYAWSNGDITASITGLVATTYTVTVTDANACTATASVTITEPTAVNLSLSSQTNIDCNGEATGSARVTATGGTEPYTYLWNDDAAQTTITASGLAAGTYQATVTDAKGCSATTSVTITQYSAILADFSADQVFGCGPLTVNFTDASSGGNTSFTTWSWDFGDGTTSDLQNPSHVYTSSGAFTVSLTVSNSYGCSKTKIKTNYIQVIGPDVDFEANNTFACEPGLTVAFSDLTTAYSPVTGWNWNFGDGQTSTLRNPSHTYTTNGSFNVSLTVSDLDGCSKTETKTAYINISTLNITSVSKTNVSCNGTATGSATVNVTGGTAPYSYEWDNDATTASIVGAVAGTYNVTVTDANGCTAMLL